jgi:hypothetical protein
LVEVLSTVVAATMLSANRIDDLNLLPHFRGIVGSTIRSRPIAIL